MNENHQRILLLTFQYVDNLLSEAEHILMSAGSSSPFQEYSQDSTPIQRKMTHENVVLIRQTMCRILEELSIQLKPPVSGAVWAVRNNFSSAIVAIEEIEPMRIGGYGEMSREDENTISKSVAELKSLLNRLDDYFCEG